MNFSIIFSSEGEPEYLRIRRNEIFKLREVTPKELYQIRMEMQPGIVYKVNGKLFFTAVNRSMMLSSSKVHLCGEDCSRVCKGCQRTRDLTVAYQIKEGQNLSEAVKQSWRIEKYTFILEGIETFNMKQFKDSLSVYSCANYKKSVNTPQKQQDDIRELKRKLALLYLEDI